ncbi:hypothetical protein V8G54_005599, partial [Vigna mungo]
FILFPSLNIHINFYYLLYFISLHQLFILFPLLNFHINFYYLLYFISHNFSSNFLYYFFNLFSTLTYFFHLFSTLTFTIYYILFHLISPLTFNIISFTYFPH